MKILTAYLDVPFRALEIVSDFLEGQGHEVDRLLLKPGDRIGQLIQGAPFKHYDVAISTEPLAMLGLIWRRRIDKTIFWRADYRPSRYKGLSGVLDWTLRNRVDEVWSIVPPTREGEKWVPFLLNEKSLLPRKTRSGPYCALWTGPVFDGGYDLAEAACKNIGVHFSVSDWSNPSTTLTDEQLNAMLLDTDIGLALYDPSSNFKNYSDPSRVKRFMAAGIPVLTTRSFAMSHEVEEYEAGFLTDWSLDSVEQGLDYCIRNSCRLSDGAKALARKYLISDEWIKL
ncbi:hypothetical protein LCGC14_1564600 [marine sediment metagenome]|uniref:Glycosyl transferase family 1 domain-containing protein n=1 Tax=marine sediment metagenome TaxID=412755 RepID=A0A0F9J7M8_9ZZZZ